MPQHAYTAQLRHTALLALLAILAASSLFGQTAQITGRVVDATGGVIPNARVSARNVDTGVTTSASTNETGYYTLALLPPGNYQVNAESAGFKPVARSGIRLEVLQIARIDFGLEVGQISERVEVVAEAPLVASEEASIGTLVDARKIQDLPLSGRNVFSLVTLVPGVTSASPGSFGRQANVSGVRENTSEVTVDGGSITSTDQGDIKFAPPLEGVEEFRVQTASFEAEHGRAGGVISMITRSGTNQLHGSLFEFLRNDALDANNFFFNASGRGKAKLRYHQFGGALGGPVYLPKIYDGRNRTFFFFTPQYVRQRGTRLKTTTIPTLAEREGDFRYSSAGRPQPVFDPATTRASGTTYVRDPFPNSVIPAARFHPMALKILETGYSRPTIAEAANNSIVSGPSIGDNNVYMIRGDHNFTPQHRLSGRYYWSTSANRNPQPWEGLPAQECSSASCNQATGGSVYNAVLRDTASLRATLLNEFTYAMVYNTANLTPASANQGWAQKLGIRNAAPYLYPNVSIAGYTGLFGGNLSTEGDVNHQFSDNLTWIRGSHTLKAGFEWRPLYFRNYQPLGTAGAFTFNALPTRNPALSGAAAGGHGVASLLLGLPSSSSLTVNNQKWGAFWRYYAGFVQDKWKVSPRLTLTYGLRWEYTRPRTERWNRQSVFDLASLKLRFAGEDAPETLFEGDFNNFAPRIGLAFSPSGDNKTAIRAAFGMYYLPVNNIGSLAQFTRGFTAARTFQTVDGGITFPMTLSDVFPVVPLSRELSPLDSISTIGPEYPAPVMHQWTLSLQREILPRTLLDVTYAGTKGTHLQISTHQLNQVPGNRLGPGDAQSRRPYPTRGDISYDYKPVGNSIYHAVYVKLEHRFSSGLNLLGWYSLSKSIDDSSGIFGYRTLGTTGIQDHHNLRAERSISSFDRTHSAVMTGIYELPFGRGKAFANGGVPAAIAGGWQMNGILTLRSGVPLSMDTSQNITGSLGGGSRPNRLRSGSLPEDQRTIRRWFDTAAFAPPAQFQFGNTSRTEPDVRGPGTVQLDFSVFRNIRLAEKMEIEIRAEAFNATNRVNFSGPSTTIGSAAAGTIASAGNSRTVQLGARFVF